MKIKNNVNYCEFSDIYYKIMDKVEKINKLKAKIKREQEKEQPNKKQIQKWVEQMAFLGIGLDINIGKKPFTHV